MRYKQVSRSVSERMARFLNRKSQRYYRLKFADTYYGEMTHYGLYRRRAQKTPRAGIDESQKDVL